mmetsp:Transcript_14099/g.50636  ORF Transcript_14099/g.50636 Transcript_14099/m.50636 type:complete len:284 (+) Transcript_14099:687-1538(+)
MGRAVRRRVRRHQSLRPRPSRRRRAVVAVVRRRRLATETAARERTGAMGEGPDVGRERNLGRGRVRARDPRERAQRVAGGSRRGLRAQRSRREGTPAKRGEGSRGARGVRGRDGTELVVASSAGVLPGERERGAVNLRAVGPRGAERQARERRGVRPRGSRRVERRVPSRQRVRERPRSTRERAIWDLQSRGGVRAGRGVAAEYHRRRRRARAVPRGHRGGRGGAAGESGEDRRSGGRRADATRPPPSRRAEEAGGRRRRDDDVGRYHRGAGRVSAGEQQRGV